MSDESNGVLMAANEQKRFQVRSTTTHRFYLGSKHICDIDQQAADSTDAYYHGGRLYLPSQFLNGSEWRCLFAILAQEIRDRGELSFDPDLYAAMEQVIDYAGIMQSPI